MFEKEKVEVECPKCNMKLKVKLIDLSPGKKIKCNKCSSDIVFKGDDVGKSIKEIEKIFKSF